MTIAHLLEDFGVKTPVEPVSNFSEEVVEEAKLVSFEKGYTAGWDDAIDAKDKEVTNVSATLASSLEDLSFTYHEAQSQLMESLDPMFKVLTSAILPDTMAATFGHHIIDHLNEMAKSRINEPMEVVAAAGEGTAIRALLGDETSLDVRVREDANLNAGQAQLRVGQSERELNSEALIESIRESIDAFSYQFKEESHYG
ncbi:MULTISPECIES: ABC transporter ATP-binding protein [Tritonibacter]|uniref:ABC transporter ATP-binding protein n=1 Tax=Tritonibacter scottomollicae TaxID=483013 RepID=A0A2T1ALP8_TRISK|nr:ABC transporter ATP-binding protein [Tritonibacter scottomollicae]PRZ49457.1 flagellar assembly protein FliH [Tritonibacter scottomollicae]WOI32418.1 ABC transporter ATP-binding protein [Tritonibacter scottomollicae]